MGVKGMDRGEAKRRKRSYEQEFYEENNKQDQYDFQLMDKKLPGKQVIEVMLNEEEEKEKLNETDEMTMTQKLQYNQELDNADETDQSNLLLLKD